ncbi:hypothetical protein HYH02_010877 [Chlamydomonas schloesseri]|uniref:FAD/NAD(P)-binding domain-containing protein n=1 Tax=Chlamydomonas schloesseri TaxID=2026947 RepID=A0A835T7G7_9CHLO|nr:hypothetical protein HYH02_010877 [Chlamydomonas schloesseri]|eukprot:KAG2438422.1 hypothetical protein HYH02_010877 [Chlamydomonas schloesseri]
MSADKPRLLVVGGGIAGVLLAQRCNPHFQVTLVDPKEYFEITWATPRGIMDPRVAAAAAINHWDIPDLGLVLQARVTQLTSRAALLSNGDVVEFDYAAVCAGSATPELFKSAAATSREQRLAEMKALHDEIRAAKSVLVVGGGPSGVELAAEVVDAFAGKAVTLVHAGPRLLQELPPRAGATAQRWLEAHHVKVMLGRRVVAPDPQQDKTQPLLLPDDPSIATTSATATTTATNALGGGGNSGAGSAQTTAAAAAARTSSGTAATPERGSWSGAGSSAHSHPAVAVANAPKHHPQPNQHQHQHQNQHQQHPQHQHQQQQPGFSCSSASYQHLHSNPLLDSAGGAAGGVPAVLQLSDGSSLAADVVLWATGSRPNAGFLAGGDLESCLNEQGAIKVLPSLQLPGQPHMFALGDCTNVPEAKLGFLAAKQAELAAASLQALARARATGGPAPKLQRWKPNGGGPAVMIVTLGREDGVMRAGGLVCSGCVPGLIKSRGLFIDKYHKLLHVATPAAVGAGGGGGIGGGLVGLGGGVAVAGAPSGVVQAAVAEVAQAVTAGCDGSGR